MYIALVIFSGYDPDCIAKVDIETLRVGTHYCCSLGKRISIEKMRQGFFAEKIRKR